MRKRQARGEQRNDYTMVRQKMKSEAEILHRCRHENVVGVIGVCDQYPRLCLMLEWCPRGSLWDVLLREREGDGGTEMPARGTTRGRGILKLDRKRLGYAMDVVSALAHIHGEAGGATGRRGWAVAHRDVKSQNFASFHSQSACCDVRVYSDGLLLFAACGRGRHGEARRPR